MTTIICWRFVWPKKPKCGGTSSGLRIYEI